MIYFAGAYPITVDPITLAGSGIFEFELLPTGTYEAPPSETPRRVS